MPISKIAYKDLESKKGLRFFVVVTCFPCLGFRIYPLDYPSSVSSLHKENTDKVHTLMYARDVPPITPSLQESHCINKYKKP